LSLIGAKTTPVVLSAFVNVKQFKNDTKLKFASPKGYQTSKLHTFIKT